MNSAEVAPKIKHAKPPSSSGAWWHGICPAHGGTGKNSPDTFGWSNGDKKIRFSCQAGCSRPQILAALGLTEEDVWLMPAQPNGKHGKHGKSIAATYDYLDEHGALLYQAVRYATPGGGKTFSVRRPHPDKPGAWIDNLPKDARRVLYHLDRLQGQSGCAIVEGCKDADNLTDAGFLATTSVFGSGAWRDDYVAQLVAAGIRMVVIFPDNDPAGEKYEQEVRDSCLQAGLIVIVVRLPGLPPKGDVSDYLAEHTIDDLFNAFGHYQDATGMHHPDPGVVKTYYPAKLDLAFLMAAGTIGALSEHEPDIDAEKLKALTNRPQLIIRDDLAVDFDNSGALLTAANTPPVLFHFGDGLVRMALDSKTGWPTPKEMTLRRLGLRLSRAARIVKTLKSGNVKNIMPPLDVVAALLEDDSMPWPKLRRMTRVPVFTSDGRLLDQEGYDPATGIYYAPSSNFTLPPVPEHPGYGDVADARTLLLDEMLYDFPFVETPEASLATAIAFLLAPFVRELFSGVYPLFLFHKPAARTGATKLSAKVLARISLGRELGAFIAPRREEEMEKQIMAALISSPQFILFDNVTHLDSPSLSRAITSTEIKGRLLGYTREITLPVTNVWLATGNNPRLSNELTGRTVSCRLDAGHPRPGERTGFRHEDLEGWTADHRGELVHACLVLVQNWLARGRPAGPSIRFGGFEDWCAITGGILDAAGIPGLLSNREELYDLVDSEGDADQAFVQAWWNAHAASCVHSSELLPLAEGAGIDVDSKSEHGKQIKLGKALKKLLKQVFVLNDGRSVRVMQPKPKQDERGTLWRLVMASMASMASETPDAAKKSDDYRADQPDFSKTTGASMPSLPDLPSSPDDLDGMFDRWQARKGKPDPDDPANDLEVRF